MHRLSTPQLFSSSRILRNRRTREDKDRGRRGILVIDSSLPALLFCGAAVNLFRQTSRRGREKKEDGSFLLHRVARRTRDPTGEEPFEGGSFLFIEALFMNVALLGSSVTLENLLRLPKKIALFSSSPSLRPLASDPPRNASTAAPSIPIPSLTHTNTQTHSHTDEPSHRRRQRQTTSPPTSPLRRAPLNRLFTTGTSFSPASLSR